MNMNHLGLAEGGGVGGGGGRCTKDLSDSTTKNTFFVCLPLISASIFLGGRGEGGNIIVLLLLSYKWGEDDLTRGVGWL